VFKASFAVLNVVLTIHLSDAADPYLGVQANFTNGDECSLEPRTAVVQFQCYAVKYCLQIAFTACDRFAHVFRVYFSV